MKAVIEILPDKIDAGNCVLICEASDEGFSYLVKDDEANLFVALATYHFNKTITSEDHTSEIKKIFDHQILLSDRFKKIYIIYSFPESVLIPFSLYNSQNNAEVLNLVHGDLVDGNVIVTDVIDDKKVYNSYRIPSEFIEEITKKFPSGVTCHQYSVLIKNLSPEGNRISVIFYSQKIVLMVEKDGRILLINSFCYKTSEDVSYILLNVCKQFDIENIPVQVSGLIEKDSGLYKEICKYFKPVSLANLPEGIRLTEGIAKYPSHFFSHFFAVDLCE